MLVFVGYITRISTTCFYLLFRPKPHNFRSTENFESKIFQNFTKLYNIYDDWIFFSMQHQQQQQRHYHSFCLFSSMSIDLLPFVMRCHCFSYICVPISFGHWTCHIIFTFSNNFSILLFSCALGRFPYKIPAWLLSLYLMLEQSTVESIWNLAKKCLIHYPDMNCIVCYFHFFIYSHDSNDTISFSLPLVNRFQHNMLLCMVLLSFFYFRYFVVFRFWFAT